MTAAAVLGDFGPESLEDIRLAVRRGDADASFYYGVDDAQEDLVDPQHAPPRCVFADGAAAGIEEFIAWMRG